MACILHLTQPIGQPVRSPGTVSGSHSKCPTISRRGAAIRESGPFGRAAKLADAR